MIHSDGQLYPQKPPPKPPHRPEPQPTPPSQAPKKDRRPEPHRPPELPWEDLLIIGVALVLLQNNDRPDLPLLLALAYILFDHQFDLKKLMK